MNENRCGAPQRPAGAPLLPTPLTASAQAMGLMELLHQIRTTAIGLADRVEGPVPRPGTDDAAEDRPSTLLGMLQHAMSRAREIEANLVRLEHAL